MVRVRPLSAKELKEGAENCIIAIDTQIAARENQFTYDFAFPSNVEQAEVTNNFRKKCFEKFKVLNTSKIENLKVF